MRVAIISKASKLGGGASLVASKLAHLLRANGHFCHHFRRDKEYGYGTDESSVFGNFEGRIKWLNHRTRKLGLQEIIPWEYFHLKAEIKRLNIDLVHIHDTTTAISPITIALLAKVVPIVWTMHDYSPFTGGCVYPVGCEKYKDSCGSCPQIDKWPVKGFFDFTALNLRLKRSIQRKHIGFISPSKFLKQQAILAGMEAASISVIPNSVDTEIFYPMDKTEAKNSLELDPNKFTILLLAFEVHSVFKGVDDALKVLQRLTGDFQVLVVGKVRDSDKKNFLGIPCVFTGYIKSQELLNICYNAADMMLNCSKADNLPLVVLESLAAGTPVYGYATGGIPEMVDNGETGLLVETNNWAELQRVVSNRMEKAAGNERTNCRKAAIERFDEQLFLQHSLSLYSSVIKNWQSSQSS